MAQFSFLDELFVLDTETLITSAVSGCCRPNVRLIRSWQSCLELMNPGPWAAMWSPTLCYIWKRCVLLAMWVFLHTYTHKQITVWTQEFKKGQISQYYTSMILQISTMNEMNVLYIFPAQNVPKLGFFSRLKM